MLQALSTQTEVFEEKMIDLIKILSYKEIIG